MPWPPRTSEPKPRVVSCCWSFPALAVLRVFALIGMDRVIPNFTSLAEALASTDRRDDQRRLACEPMTHPGHWRRQRA